MAVDKLLMIAGSQGFPALRSQLDLTSKALVRVESGSSKLDKFGARMGAVGLAGAGGLLLLGRAGLKAAGDLEATKTGFKSVLGSAEKANDLYGKIAKFSLISPANNAAVARSAQLLLATGTAAKDVVPTLHAVGNAVAFSGAKDQTEKVVQITRILAKLGARGTITSRELNQMATRNLNPYKILRDELGLTGEQVANIGREGIKASEAVPALLRGFEKLGGGKSMERMNKTYVGQLSQMEDATDQFLASAGMLVLPDATKFVSGLTKGTQALKGFVDAHPRAAGAGLKIAVGGTAALLAGSQYIKLQNILKTTAAAKLALAGATKKDSVAEAGKAVVAGREGKAIDLTKKAALGATAAKDGLTKATLTSRAVALLKTPVGPAFSTGAGPLALRGATVGSAALGAGLGAGAYAGAKDDGMSDGYAATVGLGAAALAAFNPAAAALIASAEVLRLGFNKLVNEPMENAPENQPISPDASKGPQTHAQKAAAAMERAQKLQERADAINPKVGLGPWGRDVKRQQKIGLEAEAAGARLMWRSESRISRSQGAGSPESVAAEQAKNNAAFEAANNPNRFQIGQDSGLISNGPAPIARSQDSGRITNQNSMRNGDQEITVKVKLKESRGDQLARQLNYNRATPRIG